MGDILEFDDFVISVYVSTHLGGYFVVEEFKGDFEDFEKKIKELENKDYVVIERKEEENFCSVCRLQSDDLDVVIKHYPVEKVYLEEEEDEFNL